MLSSLNKDIIIIIIIALQGEFQTVHAGSCQFHWIFTTRPRQPLNEYYAQYSYLWLVNNNVLWR